MDESFPTKEEELSPLEKFQREIKNLKILEEAKGVEAHFAEINPTELSPDDLEMYRRVEELVARGSLGESDFNQFLKGEFTPYREGTRGLSSRSPFSAYLANRLNYLKIELEEDLEK